MEMLGSPACSKRLQQIIVRLDAVVLCGRTSDAEIDKRRRPPGTSIAAALATLPNMLAKSA